MPRATKKELRNTGLIVGIAFAVFGALQILFHGRLQAAPWIQIFFGLGGLLVLLGLVAPALLRPFHFVWMKLAEALGWVMNRLLLGILFYVFITLTALILKALRRDALRLDFRKRQDSYWVMREQAPVPPERYERQF
jgi:hypothetical protein